MKKICILTTGGTLDKEHDPISETLVFSKKSHVPEMLSRLRVLETDFEQVMLKDSMGFTDKDRELIKHAVQGRKEEGIVITHGTSTMTLTAEYLQKEGLGENKTIVLTGAMRPYSLFLSDASFNLGTAIGGARSLPHGVYVAMNGLVHKAGQVQKNSATGYFEAI